MCEKTKKNIDIASILYKIFLILMIVSQIVPIIFITLPVFGILVHIILTIYLIFRYYMLVRMKNRAIEFDLTLTEFLQERENCIKNDDCKES